MVFKSLAKDNKSFLLFHTVLFLLGSYPLLFYDKVTLLLKLNSYYHSCLDFFFYYITFLGSSIAYALFIAALIVLKQNNRTLLIGVSSFGSMSIVIQGMKRIEALGQLRPITLIPADTPLHLVEGITHHTHLSFPSGHAGTIFTVVCLVHFLIPKKTVWFSAFLLLVACIVAYSRVYLLQHFYRDVYIGALLGVGITTVVYAVLKHWEGPALLSQSLIDLLPGTLKQKA